MEIINFLIGAPLFLLGSYIWFRVITLAIATSWKQIMQHSPHFIIGRVIYNKEGVITATSENPKITNLFT